MQRTDDKMREDGDENESVAQRSGTRKRFSFAGYPSGSASSGKTSSKRNNVLRKKHDRSENFTGSQQDIAIVSSCDNPSDPTQSIQSISNGGASKHKSGAQQNSNTGKPDRNSLVDHSGGKQQTQLDGAYALRASHSQPNLAQLDRKLNRSSSSKSRKAARDRSTDNGKAEIYSTAINGMSYNDFDSSKTPGFEPKTKVVANAYARSNTNLNLHGNASSGLNVMSSVPPSANGGLQKVSTSISNFPAGHGYSAPRFNAFQMQPTDLNGYSNAPNATRFDSAPARRPNSSPFTNNQFSTQGAVWPAANTNVSQRNSFTNSASNGTVQPSVTHQPSNPFNSQAYNANSQRRASSTYPFQTIPNVNAYSNNFENPNTIVTQTPYANPAVQPPHWAATQTSFPLADTTGQAIFAPSQGQHTNLHQNHIENQMHMQHGYPDATSGMHPPRRTNTAPSGQLMPTTDSAVLRNTYTAVLRRESKRILQNTQPDAEALKQRFMATLSEARTRNAQEDSMIGSMRSMSIQSFTNYDVNSDSATPAAAPVRVVESRSTRRNRPVMFELGNVDERENVDVDVLLRPPMFRGASAARRPSLPIELSTSFNLATPIAIPIDSSPTREAEEPQSSESQLNPSSNVIALLNAGQSATVHVKPEIAPPSATALLSTNWSQLNPGIQPAERSRPAEWLSSTHGDRYHYSSESVNVATDDQPLAARLLTRREPHTAPLATSRYEPVAPPLPPRPTRTSPSPTASFAVPTWSPSPPSTGNRLSGDDPLALPPRRKRLSYIETDIDGIDEKATDVPSTVVTAKLVPVPANIQNYRRQPPALPETQPLLSPQPGTPLSPAVVSPPPVTVTTPSSPAVLPPPVAATPSSPAVQSPPPVATPPSPAVMPPPSPAVPRLLVSQHSESLIDSVTLANTAVNAASGSGPTLLASLAILSGRQQSAEESEYDRVACEFAAFTALPDAYWRSLLTTIAPNFKPRTNGLEERDEEFYEDSEIDSGLIEDVGASNKSARDYLDEVFGGGTQRSSVPTPMPLGVAHEPFTEHQWSLFNRYNSIRRKLHKAASSNEDNGEKLPDSSTSRSALGSAIGPQNYQITDPEQWRQEASKRLLTMTELAKKKVDHLRVSETDVELDMRANDELGRQIRAVLLKKCSIRAEIDKYDAHVNELDKIIKLLLQLSVRLARTEQLIRETSDKSQKKVLVDKRNHLRIQYKDAKQLKVAMDKRSVAVHQTLTELFTSEEFDEYRLYVEMKAKLVIEHQELHDCLHTAEAQLSAIRNAQTALSAFTGSQLSALQSYTYQHSS